MGVFLGTRTLYVALFFVRKVTFLSTLYEPREFRVCMCVSACILLCLSPSHSPCTPHHLCTQHSRILKPTGYTIKNKTCLALKLILRGCTLPARLLGPRLGLLSHIHHLHARWPALTRRHAHIADVRRVLFLRHGPPNLRDARCAVPVRGSEARVAPAPHGFTSTTWIHWLRLPCSHSRSVTARWGSQSVRPG